MIPINRPVFPELANFLPYLEKIWANGTLTNNGPMVQELEKKLSEKLRTEHLILTANCTQALEIMLHSCCLRGRKKILTTPFSFAATLTSIVWTGFEPVFVDLDPENMCLDIHALTRAMSDDIGAVLACHLYGRPADDGRLQEFCNQHGLPLLFDGAHIFGVDTDKGPLVNEGTATALSFHATKVFGTAEGGAIITKNPDLAEEFRIRRAFGVDKHILFKAGTNAKMSELHAAFGLASLPLVEDSIRRRREIWRYYKTHLPRSIRLIDVEAPPIIKSNYAYAIAVFNDESALLRAAGLLKQSDIDTRRYFYPSLSQASYARSNSTPQADELSRRVLCLPLYADLNIEIVKKVCAQLAQS